MATVLLGSAFALGGCSDSPADQVRAKVQQLVQATAQKDYRAICEDVLAPSLVAHLTKNGIPCPAAMRLALGSVHNPTVSIGRVIIHGSTAWAITLTSARGQRATLAAIKLLRTHPGWRITSLGSPVSAAVGR
ncbi:MAG: hypothetical protein ACJ764_04320 [Solirubrobacteraceae bacterium]